MKKKERTRMLESFFITSRSEEMIKCNSKRLFDGEEGWKSVGVILLR